jgi:hypothetical protein
MNTMDKILRKELKYYKIESWFKKIIKLNSMPNSSETKLTSSTISAKKIDS